MANILRPKYSILIDSSAAAGTNTTNSDIIPSGQSWSISKVLFADQNIGDNKSGGFRFEFGTGSTWELIAGAYLTGNTITYEINRAFFGDGVKRFRVIRVNNSASAKNMIVYIEGFKRF